MLSFFLINILRLLLFVEIELASDSTRRTNEFQTKYGILQHDALFCRLRKYHLAESTFVWIALILLENVSEIMENCCLSFARLQNLHLKHYVLHWETNM